MTRAKFIRELNRIGAMLQLTPCLIPELSGRWEAWAIKDGKRFYLGVRGTTFDDSLAEDTLERFQSSNVYRLLTSSEQELAKYRADDIARIILEDAGLDLSSYTANAQDIVPRLLQGFLEDVYGYRGKKSNSETE